MSQNQIERVYTKLENHASIIEYLKENYPNILAQWKNKAGAYEAPADYEAEAITPKDQLGYDYRDK